MDFAEVEAARILLQNYLQPTRLLPAPSLSHVSGATVYLKIESECATGSFKVRGALTALDKHAHAGSLPGVVTATTGNHGAAVAYAAQLLKVPAAIFLPVHPNPVKRQRIAKLGARILEQGRDYDEAKEHARQYAREQGWTFIEDGHDPSLTAGAATVAVELLEQLPDLNVLYVPVGDTTLIRAVAFVAKLLRPEVQVIGVQAERAPAYTLSWKQRRVVSTDTCDTIADGLAVRCPREENLRALLILVDAMRLVSEKELLRAISRLLLTERVVTEPAGAATTAAFLQSGHTHAGQKVALLVTGSNVSREILRQALETD